MARKRLPDEKQLSPPSIRIPLSLREQIEQSARCNRCSLNQEVILDHILDMVETGDNRREVFGASSEAAALGILGLFTNVRDGLTAMPPYGILAPI